MGEVIEDDDACYSLPFACAGAVTEEPPLPPAKLHCTSGVAPSHLGISVEGVTDEINATQVMMRVAFACVETLSS